MSNLATGLLVLGIIIIWFGIMWLIGHIEAISLRNKYIKYMAAQGIYFNWGSTKWLPKENKLTYRALHKDARISAELYESMKNGSTPQNKTPIGIKKAGILYDLKRLEGDWIVLMNKISKINMISSQDLFEINTAFMKFKQLVSDAYKDEGW